MRRRVDNVPQSTAAKLPNARLALWPNIGAPGRQLFGDPTSHRVIAPHQVPGVVGMQALDTPPSTSHPPTRPRPRPGRGKGGVALGGVFPVRPLQFCGSHGSLRCAHPACGFQPVDCQPGLLAYQPVTGRHRGAIVEDRPIADHDRATGLVGHHNFEGAARFAAKERC